MSTYAVQGETLGLIADAIRGKLGTDEPMEVSSMASLIESISGGGLAPILTVYLDETLTVKQIWDNIYPEKDSERLVIMTTGEVDSVGNRAYILGHLKNSAGVHAYIGIRSRGGTLTSFSWTPTTEDYSVSAGKTLTFYIL